jgi:EAL domain
VNLSPVQFKQAELFDVIMSVLSESGLPPEQLELEVTESVLLERGAENYAFMQKLKRVGVSFALDDFGTGHSSLSCLTAFPFDKIKIDKSFIGNLMKNYKSFGDRIVHRNTRARPRYIDHRRRRRDPRTVGDVADTGSALRPRLSARSPGADRRTRTSIST